MPLPVAALAPVAIPAVKKVGQFIGGLFGKKKKSSPPPAPASSPVNIAPFFPQQGNFLPGVNASASVGTKSNTMLFTILGIAGGLILVIGLVFFGRKRRR